MNRKFGREHMKRTNSRKILISLMMVIIMLLVLSVKEEASTRMMDELVARDNQNITRILGTDAGIYQTALNAYMDTNKTLSSEIANSRTIFGAGEKLKIRFSFSREIANTSGLELGIKFGNGEERKITSFDKNGSYLAFSHTLKSSDTGGLSITYVKEVFLIVMETNFL